MLTLVILLASALAAGCGMSVGVATGDAALEEQYRMIWHSDFSTVKQDAAPLSPNSTGPGVCNLGGDKQHCYQVSEKLAGDLQRTLDDLEQVTVPTRYRVADAAVRIAVAQDIAGLRLRDQGIHHTDDVAFKNGNAMIADATVALEKAYEAFPSDARLDPL